MGRLLASPRLSTRPETIGRAAVSLGPDALATIDQTDRKCKHVVNPVENISTFVDCFISYKILRQKSFFCPK